ncbi:MAG: hypothetical protein IPF98_10190 [Gemmatimonadetes bacterium]|nr:hypothetical protein [Gemmatimonadota bacterium]
MHPDDLWSSYDERYGDRRSALAKDGAGQEYGPGQRLLVVLKEPNDSPGRDLRVDFLNAGAKWVIWHRIAEWATGILHGFPPYDQIQSLKNASLRRIAVINLKKLSGGASIDSATLHRHAFADRDLIRSRISDLNPTTILACGTFEPLLWLLDREVPTTANLDENTLGLTNGVTVIRWRHPSRTSGPVTYGALRSICISCEIGEKQ